MLVITTAKGGGHHVHRDNCPRITPKVNPIPAAEAEPDAVLFAKLCSRCSPRLGDVGRALEDAEARRNAPPAAPTTTRKAPKASQDAPDATLPAERPEVDPDAHQRCAGACGRDLPMRKFPTTRKGRGTECRECRDARWAAAKAAG